MNSLPEDGMLQSQVTELTLRTVTEIEELAEEILTDRAQIIDYDKKRNSNREALNALKSNIETKQWICFGNLFLKIQHENVVKTIDDEQKELNREINKIHQELKPKLKKLHELEGLEDVKGFDLNGV